MRGECVHSWTTPEADTLVCTRCGERRKYHVRNSPAAVPEPQGGQREGSRDVRTYEEAARVTHLHLAEFCNESLAFPAMVADACRRAAAELARLRAEPHRGCFCRYCNPPLPGEPGSALPDSAARGPDGLREAAQQALDEWELSNGEIQRPTIAVLRRALSGLPTEEPR